MTGLPVAGAAEEHPPGPLWLRLRNSLLSNPRFQRWAAAFPLTKLLAQRRAAKLFDLCAGFVYSQVLFAGVRLDLFELLRERPLTAAELARRLSMPVEGMRRLLDASASLGLAEKISSDSYGLGMHGAALLGNPAVAKMVEHHAILYRDLADPLALLRGKAQTGLSRFWPYASDRPDVSGYSELMAVSQQLIAADVLEAYPLHQHGRLLDVGGGTGAFLEAVSVHAPRLELMLFDLPAVAELARARLQRRARVFGGDLFRDPLPEGADAITLVRVLHDHGDAEALSILRSAHRALPEGGTLLVAEPMAGTRGAEQIGDAYFGFYLLAMGSGRPRDPRFLARMIQQAGFKAPQLLPTRRPMFVRLLKATKPTVKSI